MFAKLFIAKLLIAAFIIHDSYGYTPEEEATMKHYEEQLAIAKAYKHSQCFAPTSPQCKVSEQPTPGHDQIRWLYVPTTRICASVYMPRNDTCKDINRLPLTLKECEDLCGEPCIITYASKLSEPGICKKKCHITSPPGVSKPCPENINCCPRNYIFPTTTPVPVTTTTPVPVTTTPVPVTTTTHVPVTTSTSVPVTTTTHVPVTTTTPVPVTTKKP